MRLIKRRDYLLVLTVLGLVASAALLSQRGGARPLGPLAAAGLSLLTLSLSLAAWANWLQLGTPAVRARALLLNGAAGLTAGTLWLEFVFSQLVGLHAPLRWLLSSAIAWMIAPVLGLALTRLARRLAP